MTNRQRRHQDGSLTLREEVVRAHPDIDPDLLQKIAGAEVLATSKSVNAAGNNRFPHWNFQTWMAAFTFVMAGVWGAVGAVFFVGGEWRGFKSDVAHATEVVREIHQELRAMKMEIRVVQEDHQDIHHEIERMNGAAQRRRATPAFGPSSGSVR